jgi:2',3'-cyclic-nucleotide 2'-phosphodiesterase (5'-nucleotidase family)
MRAAPLVLALAIMAAVGLAGCQGCQSLKTNAQAPPPKHPTVRLYLLSTVSGALEPCGCSKDMLGGLDHLAAFIKKETESAPNSVVLAAGPLLFIDTKLDDKHKAQESWKAGSIAAAMKDMRLAAWAPGHNDWAAGSKLLSDSAKQAGATVLAAGLRAGQTSVAGRRVVQVGEVKVGLFGLSDPKDRGGAYPKGVEPATSAEQLAAAKREVDALKKEGAVLLVGLAAMPRGAALRIADNLPELNVLVVGKPSSHGAANTEQTPPEMIGSTLVVETANHVQAVSIVDIYLRGEATDSVKLSDAGGVKKAAEVGDLSRRIRELENRINHWEKGGGQVSKKDIVARKADLDKLKKQRDALQAEQPAPEGNFFRYRVQEIREGLGKDDAVAKQMVSYYKRVNAHNKKALAGMLPPKASKDEAYYVGMDECESCHMEEQEVWEKSGHAKAYKTLTDDFKEFNLECVSCHVTGYGKPGGSTVTHVDKLKDVQCETCHGPGSKHLEEPEEPNLITLTPDPESCVEECHHPPHVEAFDPIAMMKLVLGPGHGEDWKPPGQKKAAPAVSAKPE